MSPSHAPIVFTAVHMGPYQSIAPLEALMPTRPAWMVEGVARQHRAGRGEPLLDGEAIERAGGAVALLRALGTRVLVRSTSHDVGGEKLEETLTSAATACGIPVVVVEDFPGNYRAPADAGLDALCVEAAPVAALHTARGVPAARIHVTGNPRYDACRDVDRARLRPATRARLGLGDEAALLWVGQPDAEDSFRTLEVLLPGLRAAGGALLFRAHPRDAAYASGRYAALLGGAGVVVHDVTGPTDVSALCCAADLVATQFSSVAVEAGYLGTPALFALLPTLGGAYIRKHKGYAIPPWCKENCAFLLDDAKMAAVVVDSAMHDPEAREAVRVNFVQRYANRPPSAPAVARIITACLER